MGERKKQFVLLIDYITSEYSDILMHGIQDACKEADVDLYVFSIGELHNLQIPENYQYLSLSGLLTSANVDGIILAAGTQMHFMTRKELSSYFASYKSIPIVSISIALTGIPSIIVDCQQAYKELISNLVQVQGCKKFGIMGVRSNSAEVRERTRFIKQYLEEEKIPKQNVHLWRSRFDYSSTVAELNYYYQVNGKFDFDAIICLNDEMAFACMDFCRLHDLKVPDDVLIAGYDDIERTRVSLPSMTSINQRLYDQGFQSVKTLNDIINKKDVPKVQVIEAKTIIRDSCIRNKKLKPESNYLLYEKKTDMTFFSNTVTTEWYAKKNQIFQINSFYNQMQYDISKEQLKKRINSEAQSFGLSAFAIVLYNIPIDTPVPFDYFTMPKKAYLFSGYDEKSGYNSDQDKHVYNFDPKTKILPEEIFVSGPEGFYVCSLFHKTLQYGYLVFRAGDYDLMIYDLFTKIISSIIASVHTFELVHDEHKKTKQKYDQLDVIASTDELTGLYNRRGLYEVGQTTLKFAKAMNQSGIIVFSDMDNLKKINDTYGHEAGDKAIIAESIILKGNFRSNDVISRIGGDEFVMVCPGLTKEAFLRIKKQINSDCEMWSQTSKSPFGISISMGFVEYPHVHFGYQMTALLAKADSLLYQEKRKKKAKL